jgi:hypothetical protein
MPEITQQGYGHQACCLGDLIYIAGVGRDGRTVFVFDPIKNDFVKKLARTNFSVRNGDMFTMNGKLYTFGETMACEYFDFVDDKWKVSERVIEYEKVPRGLVFKSTFRTFEALRIIEIDKKDLQKKKLEAEKERADKATLLQLDKERKEAVRKARTPGK